MVRLSRGDPSRIDRTLEGQAHIARVGVCGQPPNSASVEASWIKFGDPRQGRVEERFEILLGTARLSIRGQQRDVFAEEAVVVPAGTPHVWGNPHEDGVHLIIEFRPALRMEEWFETFFGLQKDGKVNPNSGLPNLMQWAVISREYEDEIYLAWPPLLAQRVRFGLLATIGKLVGYKARYPAYSGAEEPLAGRESKRPSAGSVAKRWGIVVGAIFALIALFLLRRRVLSGRKSKLRFLLPRNPSWRSS
jgi:hypothetical protein